MLFNIEQARPITLRVRDEKGEPSIASFTIKDLQGRIYPNPSKRLAPDFPFQPQVYRADGEQVRLPDGYYSIEYGGGPEFYRRTKELPIEGNAPRELWFQLQRWIDPSKYGWWSGDHHVHASGCSHYKNPTEGVHPEDMIRQILGENLNIGAVLTWGPSWYYQKQFFSSKDHQLSKAERVMHYDVEVSGFPSSHAGHLVLLGLQEDDYPGTTRVDEWPSWDLPVLQWGQRQGAIVGFSHSGWGLQVKSDKLPNYEMPGFDGIGANEFIVDVTHDAVDFISTVDTPSVWELNIWYHTLNVGFRSRVSGETDFPCIYDDKVGLGRSYVKLDRLTYQGWIEGVRDGRCYVSEGKSHLMDFAVNGVEVGTNDSEVHLKGPQKVRVTAKTAAFLDRYPDPTFFDLGYAEKPYWDVERARVPDTREVPVELIVNGEAVASQNLLADGQVREMAFDVIYRQEQLDCSSHPAVFAHEPNFCTGRRQADSRIATQRGMVPGGSEPMLEPEGPAYSRLGERCRAESVRSRPRDVSAAAQRVVVVASLHFSPPDGRSTRYDRQDFVALACRAQRTVQVRLRAPSGARLVLTALYFASARGEKCRLSFFRVSLSAGAWPATAENTDGQRRNAGCNALGPAGSFIIPMACRIEDEFPAASRHGRRQMKIHRFAAAVEYQEKVDVFGFGPVAGGSPPDAETAGIIAAPVRLLQFPS